MAAWENPLDGETDILSLLCIIVNTAGFCELNYVLSDGHITTTVEFLAIIIFDSFKKNKQTNLFRHVCFAIAHILLFVKNIYGVLNIPEFVCQN